MDAPRLLDLLRTVDFGGRTAEEETKELSNYFVETESWRTVWSGANDIVFAPKGGGKSAIYSMLDSRDGELFDRGVILVACENPTGDSAFASIKSDPPTSESEFVSIWRLYLLALTAQAMHGFGVRSDEAKALYSALEACGLLLDEGPRRTFLRRVREYVERLANPGSVEGSVALDPATGAPVALSTRISFEEVSTRDEEQGRVSAEQLYELADVALRESELVVWLMLDRLDVAFVDSPELEANALRALFRVYSLLTPLDRITLKIFLRTDIWDQITAGGFREMSHITRDLEITWNRASLLQMVTRRLVRSAPLVQALGVDADAVLNDVEAQKDLFARVFPLQVDAGKRKLSTFDWCLSRTRDGKRVNAPRELIHLFGVTREKQVHRLETGEPPPSGDLLFEPQAFKDALPVVSEARLVRTLYAEYPDLKDSLEKLRGARTHQSRASLAAIWETDEGETRTLITRLIDIGFFEPRGTAQARTYWVPFLYRPALEMVQGAAEGMATESSDDEEDSETG